MSSVYQWYINSMSSAKDTDQADADKNYNLKV